MSASDALRELPPEQEVRRSHWSRLRLVPLCVLLVLVLAATIVGTVWRTQHPAGALPTTTEEPGDALPPACTPEFDRGTTGEPWQGEAAAESEAIWQEHADEVAAPVVDGQDGHAFLGEAYWSNMSQAVGRAPLSAERLGAWNAYINDMRAELEQDGRELYVVFAPAKWEIEHAALPEWMQPLRGQARLDQLMDAYPDLPIVDVRDAMASAAQEHPVYATSNSHWTPFGAYAAYGTLAACLEADAGIVAPQPAIAGVESLPDRDEFSSYGWQGQAGQDWTVPTYAEPVSDMELTTADGSTQTVPTDTEVDMLQLPATTTNASAASDLDVLYVRDSTGNAMGPLLQSSFASTTQIRHFVDDPTSMPDVPQAAQDADSDLVVLMITERYLDAVPGVGVVP